MKIHEKYQVAIIILLTTLMVVMLISCSDDSMDMPIDTETYYIKVVEVTLVYKLTYSDATKTTILQKVESVPNSGSKIIYEITGVTVEQKDNIKNRYSGITDQYLTNQGTIIDYEWNISYNLTMNKL